MRKWAEEYEKEIENGKHNHKQGRKNKTKRKKIRVKYPAELEKVIKMMEEMGMIGKSKLYNKIGLGLLRKCIEEEIENPCMNVGRLYLL